MHTLSKVFNLAAWKKHIRWEFARLLDVNFGWDQYSIALTQQRVGGKAKAALRSVEALGSRHAKSLGFIRAARAKMVAQHRTATYCTL